MKNLIKTVLIVTVLSPFFTTELVAQRPFERLHKSLDELRPRGRILRELFGEEEKKDAQRQPKEADRRSQSRQPNRGDVRSRAQNYRGQANSRNQRNRQPTLAASPQSGNPASHLSRQPMKSKTKKHPTRLEFFLTESKKPEGLLVKKIASTGAAYLAGIRKGDVLVSIGGLAVTQKEDVAGITDVMKEGDQIEFEIARKGKKQKMLVQFGDLPEEDSDYIASETKDISPLTNAPTRSPQGNSVIRSVLNNGPSNSSSRRSAQNNTRSSRNNTDQDWPVLPPNLPPKTSDSQSIPPIRSAPNSPTMKPASDQQIRELTKRVEEQRIEIEMLRRQLERNQAKGTSKPEEIDPLLDFDSGK